MTEELSYFSLLHQQSYLFLFNSWIEFQCFAMVIYWISSILCFLFLLFITDSGKFHIAIYIILPFCASIRRIDSYKWTCWIAHGLCTFQTWIPVTWSGRLTTGILTTACCGISGRLWLPEQRFLRGCRWVKGSVLGVAVSFSNLTSLSKWFSCDTVTRLCFCVFYPKICKVLWEVYLVRGS